MSFHPSAILLVCGLSGSALVHPAVNVALTWTVHLTCSSSYNPLGSSALVATTLPHPSSLTASGSQRSDILTCYAASFVSADGDWIVHTACAHARKRRVDHRIHARRHAHRQPAAEDIRPLPLASPRRGCPRDKGRPGRRDHHSRRRSSVCAASTRVRDARNVLTVRAVFAGGFAYMAWYRENVLWKVCHRAADLTLAGPFCLPRFFV